MKQRVVSLLIFVFVCAASCQMVSAQDISNTVFDYDDFTGYVELTADIASSTNSGEIDTYASASEVFYGGSGGAVGVENDLYENGGEIDYSTDEEGGNGAAAFMADPIDLGQSYTVIATAYSCPYFGEGGTNCYPIDGNAEVSLVAGAPEISNISPPSDFPGASGVMTIDGDNLVDPFNNQVSASIGGGISLSPGSEMTSSEITLNYSIPWSDQELASGPQTLTLSNRFGSGTGTFAVGDHTPVITGISPATWQAGITTTVNIYGQYFGNVLATLTFSDPSITYQIIGYDESQIVANITVPGSDPGGPVNVSVTSNGYVGFAFYPGQGQSSTSSSASANITPEQQNVPIPTNFRVNSVTADSSGVLNWAYYWDSSVSGADVSDLGNCAVREYVTYPGSGNFNWNSPPYDTSDNPTANPTVGTAYPGTNGAVGDQQLHPGFLQPYTSDSFTANQVFQFSCTNYQSGAWQNLSGQYSIVRTVSGSGSTWTYTVTKDGHNGTVQLP